MVFKQLIPLESMPQSLNIFAVDYLENLERHEQPVEEQLREDLESGEEMLGYASSEVEANPEDSDLEG